MISIGASCGMAYLHGQNPPIVHRFVFLLRVQCFEVVYTQQTDGHQQLFALCRASASPQLLVVYCTVRHPQLFDLCRACASLQLLVVCCTVRHLHLFNLSHKSGILSSLLLLVVGCESRHLQLSILRCSVCLYLCVPISECLDALCSVSNTFLFSRQYALPLLLAFLNAACSYLTFYLFTAT